MEHSPLTEPLTEQVALRIAVAVRVLPDIDVRSLVRILIAAVGQPVTAGKLSKLRLNRFKRAANGLLDAIDDTQVKQALAFLKGRGIECEAQPLPMICYYRDGDMPGSIRVACSSDNGENIDGHFGSCARFLIYQVAAQQVQLIDIRTVPAFAAGDDKNVKRAELINDCHVLGTKSIGGPAAAKVVRAGLHPIKLHKVIPAPEFIGQLQQVLQDSPPPWLAKVMGEQPQQRIRFMEAGQ